MNFIIRLAAVTVVMTYPSLFAASNSCSDSNNSIELIRCALSQDLELVTAQKNVKILQLNEAVAGQGINPELDAEYSRSEDEGLSQSSGSLTYLHTIQLGGKVAAKQALAQQEALLGNLKWEQGREDRAHAYRLKMYQILSRQEELDALKETIDSYGKVVNAYKLRKALSPQTRMSAQIFTMAMRSGRVRLGQKQAEMEQLIGDFEVLGIPRKLLMRSLPSAWPKWKGLRQGNGTSVLNRIYESDVKVASTALSLAKSQAYENLKIGPSVSWQQSGENTQTGFGFAVSMNLPLSHRNQAGIAKARAELAAKSDFQKLASTVLERQLKLASRQYATLKSQLRQLPSDSELEKSHAALERDVRRGVIEASLIIEGHEQLLTMIESRNILRESLLQQQSKIYTLKNLSWEGALR